MLRLLCAGQDPPPTHPPTSSFELAAPCAAQVYKKLGQPSQAMVNLTRALDLSPKDAQQIKAAILNLEREDNADEQEEY